MELEADNHSTGLCVCVQWTEVGLHKGRHTVGSELHNRRHRLKSQLPSKEGRCCRKLHQIKFPWRCFTSVSSSGGFHFWQTAGKLLVFRPCGLITCAKWWSSLTPRPCLSLLVFSCQKSNKSFDFRAQPKSWAAGFKRVQDFIKFKTTL